MSTASLRIDEWVEQRSERERRDIRRRLIASAIGHALFVLLLFGLPSPPPSLSPLQAVVSVDLLASLPRPVRAPAPTPTPVARPPAPKPPPRQKTKVLPREAPAVRATPAPKPPPLDYDGALSSLRDELGETAPLAEQVLDSEPTADRSSGRGRVDPALAAWQLAVNRALARSWVTPTEYRDSELRTLLLVTVMNDGSVLGEPRVERSSGNVHFDDNAVRAVLQASPLPAPPASGDWPFLFNPTE